MRNITIAGASFEISEPYVEGHVISAIEATRLNQLRGENIANNMRKGVKAAVASDNVDEMRREIVEYDNVYVFTAVSAGGRRTMDPVERECRAIARESIRKSLADESPPRKLKDIDDEKLEAAIADISEREVVVKLAKKRVAEKQKLVETSMEGIDL